MRRIGVIGGGLVGLCSAEYLRRAGMDVVVIDPCQDRERCSFGNSGSISSASIMPLSSPGMIPQVMKWMLDARSPLKLDWRRLPGAAGWLARMIRAGRIDRVRASADALARLLAPAFDAYRELLSPALCAQLFRHDGQLYIYDDRNGLERDRFGRELRMQYGLRSQIVDAHEIAELEPALRLPSAMGVFFPDAGRTVDPDLVLRRLYELFQGGGRVIRGRAARLRPLADCMEVTVDTDGSIERFDGVVLAAGAWSKALCAMAGVTLPLESLRGYSVDYHANLLTRPVFLTRSKVFMTPMEFGLRAGGVVEIAGLERAPDWRHAQTVALGAQSAIPALAQSQPASRWMGHRPSTPDSVPVISRLPGTRRIVVATGHGSLGFMSAASSGKLAAELLLDRPAFIDPHPYRVERFA